MVTEAHWSALDSMVTDAHWPSLDSMVTEAFEFRKGASGRAWLISLPKVNETINQ